MAVSRTKRSSGSVVAGGERVVDGAAVGGAALHAEARRQVGLRVEVDEEDALVGEGEGGGEVDGGGGLADAALLVRDCDDLAHFQTVTGGIPMGATFLVI